jgi:hypothetical protein
VLGHEPDRGSTVEANLAGSAGARVQRERRGRPWPWGARRRAEVFGAASRGERPPQPQCD